MGCLPSTGAGFSIHGIHNRWGNRSGNRPVGEASPLIFLRSGSQFGEAERFRSSAVGGGLGVQEGPGRKPSGRVGSKSHTVMARNTSYKY